MPLKRSGFNSRYGPLNLQVMIVLLTLPVSNLVLVSILLMRGISTCLTNVVFSP